MAIKAAIFRKHMENASWLVDSFSHNVSDAYEWIVDQAKHGKLALSRRMARDRAVADLGLDLTMFNVGVCGPIRSGKSRLINALRNVKSHPELIKAPFLGVEKQNAVVVDYANHENDTVYWKVLQSDYPDSTLATYIHNNYLLAFDLVLILTGDKLRMEETGLARELRADGVQCALIRSKCDRDLQTNVNEDETGVDRQLLKRQFWETGHDTFDHELALAFQSVEGEEASDCIPKVFFVSATYFDCDIDDEKKGEKHWLKLDENRLISFLRFMKEVTAARRTLSASTSHTSDLDKEQLIAKDEN